MDRTPKNNERYAPSRVSVLEEGTWVDQGKNLETNIDEEESRHKRLHTAAADDDGDDD